MHISAPEVPPEKDCPFCEIVARDDPDARELFRNAHVVAFFPLEPATLGHTLIVPRAHKPDIWTLTAEDAAHIAEATLKVAHAIRKVMRPDGLNVIQSNGEAATQTVMHLHVHVVPRWSGDSIGRIWPPSSPYTEEQKDDAWELLRQEFRAAT
ncbi:MULTISPECIES: HIT family protein [Kribbella]|uniref:HIT family protein n=1 Tax=Kribbella TaxID=182639 RepID=UPI00104A5D8F|nr:MULTISPECIES: HIT domain-containing protein [Kribbella]